MSSGKFRQIVGLVLLASLAFRTYSCTVASSKEEFSAAQLLPTKHLSLRHRRRTGHSIRQSVTANRKREFTWRFTKVWLNTIPRLSRPNRLWPNAGTSTTTHPSLLFTCEIPAAGPTAIRSTRTTLFTVSGVRW
jgi:hypothetical protein